MYSNIGKFCVWICSRVMCPINSGDINEIEQSVYSKGYLMAVIKYTRVSDEIFHHCSEPLILRISFFQREQNAGRRVHIGRHAATMRDVFAWCRICVCLLAIEVAGVTNPSVLCGLCETRNTWRSFSCDCLSDRLVTKKVTVCMHMEDTIVNAENKMC